MEWLLAVLGLLVFGGLLFGALAALLCGGLESSDGVAGVVVLVACGLLFASVLLQSLGDAAWAENGVGREEEEALVAERVEQLAVVADEESHAGKAAEGADEEAACLGVDVVGGLVEGEEVGLPPQRHGDLRALALAMAERLPAAVPVGADAQQPTALVGDRVVGEEEFLPALRWLVGALDDVFGGAEVVDVAGGGLQFAAGQLHQRALAAAVGADDAGPAVVKARLNLLQQRRHHARIGEGDAVKTKKLLGHAAFWSWGNLYQYLFDRNSDCFCLKISE